MRNSYQERAAVLPERCCFEGLVNGEMEIAVRISMTIRALHLGLIGAALDGDLRKTERDGTDVWCGCRFYDCLNIGEVWLAGGILITIRALHLGASLLCLGGLFEKPHTG